MKRVYRGVAKRRRGFTLQELLVVVLVIGILSAIAFPMYTRAVRKARSMDALITMRDLVAHAQAAVIAAPAHPERALIEATRSLRSFTCGNDSHIPDPAGNTAFMTAYCSSKWTNAPFSFRQTIYPPGRVGELTCINHMSGDVRGLEVCRDLGFTVAMAANNVTGDCVSNAPMPIDQCLRKP